MIDLVKAALSPAECRVAEALLDGMKNSEIAAHLGIANGTVKARMQAMFLKFQIEGPNGLGVEGHGKRLILARKLLGLK